MTSVATLYVVIQNSMLVKNCAFENMILHVI